MHPVLFRIGNFSIGTYGVAIVVGLLAAMGLMSRLARRRGLRPEFFHDLVFVALLSGFIGARLAFILLNWGEFLETPMALLFSRQGFVFHGGFIAAVGCAQGLRTRGGAVGVGRATRSAVVISYLLIIVLGYYVTFFFYRLKW